MSMFAELPESIKQQVIRYLQANNFPAAKQLYDDWKSSQSSQNDGAYQQLVSEEH